MADAIISRITGPVVVAKDIEGAHMFDVVRIGEMGLMGEIIRLEGNTAQIQVYEDTPPPTTLFAAWTGTLNINL